MPFIQPNNNASAYRSTGQANRSQLCRGNDAKCCRQAGQAACVRDDGADLCWPERPPRPPRLCPQCGQAECACQADQPYTEPCGAGWQREQTDCGCEREMPKPNRQREQTGCGCEKEAAEAPCARTGDRCASRKAGMVYHVEHVLEKMFSTEQALTAGTLFMELYKPMNCAGAPDPACITPEQQLAFVLWELRLYLNTHPCNQQALALYRRLSRQAECETYATAFVADDGCANTWGWIENPWPWEYGHNCCEKEGKR